MFCRESARAAVIGPAPRRSWRKLAGLDRAEWMAKTVKGFRDDAQPVHDA
jgi:hypothetical protein